MFVDEIQSLFLRCMFSFVIVLLFLEGVASFGASGAGGKGMTDFTCYKKAFYPTVTGGQRNSFVHTYFYTQLFPSLPLEHCSERPSAWSSVTNDDRNRIRIRRLCRHEGRRFR